MTTARLLLVLLAGLLFGAGCTHDVTIKSKPPGARIFVDGVDQGETPVVLEESAGFFEEKRVRVEKEGYQPIETVIVQAEPRWGCVAPSLCLAPFTFGLSCFGLMWATKYAEEYEIVLDPIRKDGKPAREGEGEPEDLDPEMTVPY